MENLITKISLFLKEELNLELHPDKIFIQTFSSGVDFLGVVNFSNHKILRTKTKKRMFRNLSTKYNKLEKGLITKDSFNQNLQSYLGLLAHVDGNKIERKIRNSFNYH